MYKIRRNDIVQVTVGRDKGKKGKVLRLFSGENRVIVEGINLIKKHQRRRQQEQQAGIVSVPAPVHVSNLILICKSCNRPTRAGFMTLADGTKSRICRKCKEPL